MDRISNLPPSIIETILCLLPYNDVVRTSTLSKEWRYHWTKITKIVVIEDTQSLKRSKLLSGVGQALLMHEGPIHEVTLSVATCGWRFATVIHHIISHLSSKKAVKKLSIDFVSKSDERKYMSLPISLFSMSQLTDLYLNSCNFTHKPRFSHLNSCNFTHKPRFSGLKRRRKGQTSWAPKKKKKQNKTSRVFGSLCLTSLTSLYVKNSRISIKTLVQLLSTCPLLKTVALRTHDFYDYNGVTYTDVFESLKLIESLTIWWEIIKVLAPASYGYLVHLKYLCIEGLHNVHQCGIQVISLLIRSSLNLEKLKLNFKDKWRDGLNLSLSLKDDEDFPLEYLSELEITYFSSAETELDIVKLILMRSPVLKKLRISRSDKDKELQILQTLVESPRVSPVLEFIVENEPF